MTAAVELDASNAKGAQPKGTKITAAESAVYQATSQGIDDNADSPQPWIGKNLYMRINKHFSFAHYLLNVQKSPLNASLATLQLDNARWRCIIAWPFTVETEEVERYAAEARHVGGTLAALATKRGKDILVQAVGESLTNGDAWIQRWINNEPLPPPDVNNGGHSVMHPTAILAQHSGKWDDQWLTYDKAKVAEVNAEIEALLT